MSVGRNGRLLSVHGARVAVFRRVAAAWDAGDGVALLRSMSSEELDAMKAISRRFASVIGDHGDYSMEDLYIAVEHGIRAEERRRSSR